MDSLTKHPRYRSDKNLIQKKTTGLLSDTLGPFPDEPIISVVDKTLFFSYDLYYNLKGSEESIPTLTNSGYLTDVSSASKSSKKMSSIQLVQTKRQSVGENISQSCSNLSQILAEKKIFESGSKHEYEDTNNMQKNKEALSKYKKSNERSSCPKCNNIKNRQWVVAKTTAHGIKSYEIWSGDEASQCPSIIFIVPPCGEVISFESVSNK